MRSWTSLLTCAALIAAVATADAGDRKDRSKERRRSDSSIRKVAAVETLPSLSLVQVPPAPAAEGFEPYPASSLTPVPEPGPLYGPVPMGEVYGAMPHGVGHPSVGGPPVLMEGCPCALFDCVEYEDRDHIHPCAVPQVVAVADPCPSCDCCGPKCVYVMICVPPCKCPKIKVSDKGREVKYDFGDYQVEIESEDGKVFVDYDD